MFSSPLPNGLAAARVAIEKNTAKKAACLESQARLIEGALPGFYHSEERQFYRDLVHS